MEEDMKKIEEFIKDIDKCSLNDCSCGLKDKTRKCNLIRNLLKRYKELEEEVESQDKTIDKLVEEQEEREKYTHSLEEENKRLNENNINMQKELFINSIPISVIQNKKSELEEVLEFVKTGKSEFSKGQASVLERIIKMFENEILEKGNK